MADEDFSPETHRFAEPRYFDDFRVGERFYIPSRTMTTRSSRPSSSPPTTTTRSTTIAPTSARGATVTSSLTGVVVMRVSIHNQDKQLVLEGEHRYLLRSQL
jgi:acyl dehydratase